LDPKTDSNGIQGQKARIGSKDRKQGYDPRTEIKDGVRGQKTTMGSKDRNKDEIQGLYRVEMANDKENTRAKGLYYWQDVETRQEARTTS